MGSKNQIKAIILTGSRDFGRCPLTSQLPTALWPVAGKTALGHLLTSLADQGIKQATICSNGDGSPRLLPAGVTDSIQVDNRMELEFLDEPLPVGTAGAIRDAAGAEKDTLFFVLPASTVCPPRINVLLSKHREGDCDLTVMFNPGHGNGQAMGGACGIYVCNSSILEHIPKAGYFDIKEGLIPEMLRAGKTVHAATLPNHAGNFRGRQEYLYAITNYLENSPKLDADLKTCKGADSQTVWIAANAKVDQGARIYGPAVIMDGACVSKGAVILGPTIIGNNVTVGQDSTVVNSVLWDGARVGPNCQIQRCVLDYNAALRANTVVEEKSIPFKPEGILEHSASQALKVAQNNAGRLQHALQPLLCKINSAGHLMVEKMPDWVQSRKTKIVPWLAGGLVLIAFLWSYKAGLADLWNLWQRSDEHSSGLLVPFLAVYVLWTRRQDIARCDIKPCIRWGLLAFIGAQAVRLLGLYLLYDSPETMSSAERMSIVFSIAALVLLLFGWQLFRKVSTVLLFLCLMIPWPAFIQVPVAQYLQGWATSSAVFCLETIGYDVMREGNVINIGETAVAVAEACNGLRMVTAFFVISGLVVLLAKRALWEKLIVLASSLPVALLCNTVRLAITAIAFTILDGEQWEKIFHDFGGYAMMPLALAAVVAEFWLLRKLTTVPTQEKSIIITRQDN